MSNIQTIRRKTRARFNRRLALGDDVQDAAHRALIYCDTELLEAHGVEFQAVPNGFSCNHIVEGIAYVNMGDCYVETIIWDNIHQRFYSCSVGDMIEKQHKRWEA